MQVRCRPLWLSKGLKDYSIILFAIMFDDGSSEMLCFSFVWKIENFSHCLEKTNEPLESPAFFVDNLSGTVWRLLLYPRGTDDESRIAFYLQRERSDSGPLGITVNFELSFIAPDGITILKMAELNEHAFEVGDGYGIPLFVARDDVLRAEKDLYVPDDILTARCRLWKSNTSLAESGECVALTRIGVEKGFFKWDIRDFSKLQANKQTTLVVERDSKPDAPISLALYLSGSYGNDRKIQIDLSLCKVPAESFSTCNVSVLDAKGMVLESSENEHWFQAMEGEQVWHLNPFISKNYLVSKKRMYLPNDVLCLQFEYCLSVGVQINELEGPTVVQRVLPMSPSIPPMSPSVSPSVQESSPPKNASTQANTTKAAFSVNARNCVPLRSYTEFSNTFVHDLHCMYDENILCDFTFRAGAEAFPVHKCVLGARSPVFRAMFTNEMAEHGTTDSNLPLDIPDLDAETMHYLLTFLYTDSVDGVTWDGAYKLYFAADKYVIQSLKQRCAAILAGGLAVGNVCRVLMLSDMHQDRDLKMAAQEFVLRNDAEVLRSQEWKDFEDEDVMLAFETMKEVYMRRLQI